MENSADKQSLLDSAATAKEWLALARQMYPNQQLTLPRRFIKKAEPRENKIDHDALAAAVWVRTVFEEQEERTGQSK